MSRAYEALLKKQLQRLDRLIADTEAVRSKSNDHTTLQQIAFDLNRWQDSRDHIATILARTKRWNRYTSGTLATFAISFALVFIFAFFTESLNAIVILLMALDLVIILTSGIGCIAAITVRDAVARGGEPWRFSLRSVLIVMTAIALAFGALAWAARH